MWHYVVMGQELTLPKQFAVDEFENMLVKES